MNRTHWLELRIPPPVVLLVAGALMWLLAWAEPSWRMHVPGRIVLAVAFAVAGVLVAVAGVLEFRRARTTVNPLTPQASSSLVTTGIFGWTRNPMYVGLTFVLLGWAVFLASPLALLVLPGFMLYISRFQITPEERVLASIFGAEFAGYSRKVRRWI